MNVSTFCTALPAGRRIAASTLCCGENTPVAGEMLQRADDGGKTYALSMANVIVKGPPAVPWLFIPLPVTVTVATVYCVRSGTSVGKAVP